MKRILAFILCVVFVCTMPAMNVSAAEYMMPIGAEWEKVQLLLEHTVESNKGYYASFATSVFQGEEILYEKHFGYIDRENQIPADETCVYEWGSVSKLLVWVSVLQLYEQEKIDLEADIREYLPEDFFKKLKYEDSITMLHLMNHNAGWEETSLPIETEEEEDILPLEEALRKLEPAQTFRPGEITAYSNWGTALAGYIVERISGMEYVEYVRKNILNPLGMEQTAVRPDYRDNEWVRVQREKQKSYLIVGNKQVGLITDEDLGSGICYIQLYPAGAVVGTLADLTKFGQAFVSEDCPLFERKETLEFMLSASDFYGDSDIPKNCHGLWCTEYAVRTLGHGGNTTGGSANLVFDKDSKMGVVVLTNQQAESLFCYKIPELVFGSMERGSFFRDATITTEMDLSGDYVMGRGYFEGGRKIVPCLTYVPLRASEDARVFTQLEEPALEQFGDHLYRIVGSNEFVYATTTSDGKLVLESAMMTLLRDEAVEGESSAVTMFAMVAVAGVILLLAMLVIKLLMQEVKVPAAKWLVAGAIAVVLLGIYVFSLFIDSTSLVLIQVLNVLVGCGVMICLAVCLLSAGVAVKTAIKEKGLNWKGRLLYVVYALCQLYVIGFAVYFRLFDFWT